MSHRRIPPQWFTSSLYCGLAILLVAMALVYLGTEKPCCAEELGFPFPIIASHETAGADHVHERAHASSLATDDRSPAHSDNGPDDCFCCAISTPPVSIAVDTPLGRDPAADPLGITLPSASPMPPFHPPRFA